MANNCSNSNTNSCSPCTGCEDIVSSDCVSVLSSISCINMSSGDNLTDVLNALGSAVCNFYSLIDAGNGLTVEESDGSPSYTAINTLMFNQDSGFIVTQPGANQAEVRLIPTFLFPDSTLVLVDAVTTGNITLSGAQTIDTIVGVAGTTRVLVWKQTLKTENGVYLMQAGAWTRTTDSDTSAELNNQVVFANYTKTGTTYGGNYFNQIAISPTIGADNIIYQKGNLGGNKLKWSYDGDDLEGVEKYIGTISNDDFPIRTNDIEKARVFKTGEIGINISTSPLARLHVKGSGTTNSTINFQIQNNDNTRNLTHYDNGVIGRNGVVYSIQAGFTSTSWGLGAGAAAAGLNTGGVFIGYYAGAASTNSNVIVISGDSNNVISANYGNGTVAVGNGAVISATGTYNTAYGTSAGSRTIGGASNLYLGSYADRNDSSSTLSNISGDYNIIIGSNNIGASAGTSYTGGNALDCVWAVHGIGTASNQIVFGGGIADTYYTDLYLGAGVTNITVRDITIHATSGSGTDIAGANLKFAVGQGTGTGIAGDHIFYKATAGSTGSTLNALSETFKIKGTDGRLFRDGALYSVETGSFARENTSWGLNSLVSATGTENAAFGFQALLSVIGGGRLTAMGNNAAVSNISGFQGCYFGFKAGALHTSDGASLYGEFSGGRLTTSTYTTAIGHRTLVDNTVSVGITGGSYVTALGASAGQRGTNASISNSTYLGSQTISEVSNEAVIGGKGNTNFYFGVGKFGTSGSTSLYNIIMQPTSPATGSNFYTNQTDTNGINWTFGVSQPTGTGTAGNIIWQYAPTVEGSGSVQNALVTGMTFKGSNGTLGIGLTPTKGYLEIKAGTTTLAPLVLTSGTNNTTAQPGAIEYNGTNLFFTRTGTTREGVLTQSAVTTEVVVSDTTVTVNIGGVTYKLLARA